MSTDPPRRIDLSDPTLAWGDATLWKARLREESARAHEERSPRERLRLAPEMVARNPRRGDEPAR